MFCRKCGTEIKVGKFCPKCGAEASAPNNAGAQEAYKSAPEVVPVNQQPVNNINMEMAPVMSVWGYVGLFLLGAIPVVGTIMIIVFAISNTNPNRRNYCRAIILIWIISIILAALFGGAIGGLLYSLV